MPTDLKTLLQQHAPTPSAEIDVAALWTRSRRDNVMRRIRRFVAGIGVIAVGVVPLQSALAPAGREDEQKIDTSVTVPGPDGARTLALERGLTASGSGGDGRVAGWPLLDPTTGKAGHTGGGRRTGGTAAVAPTGSMLAYTVEEKIHLAGLDGSGARAVADGVEPAWSPDGTKIAFWRSAGSTQSCRYSPERGACPGTIWVMDADGSNQRMLGEGRQPDWSPDGSKLVFVSLRDGGYLTEIYTMAADGSGLRRLTNNDDPDWDPAWSPDGRRIVQVRLDGCSNRSVACQLTLNMYVLDLESGSERAIVRNSLLTGSPAWSPDGQQIAFAATTGRDDFEIWVMNADGSDKQRITSDPDPRNLMAAFDAEPVWLADGEHIVFMHDPDGPDGITPTASVNQDLSPSHGGPAQPRIDLIRRDGTGRRTLVEGGTSPSIRLTR